MILPILAPGLLMGGGVPGPVYVMPTVPMSFSAPAPVLYGGVAIMIETNLPDLIFAVGDDWPEIPFAVLVDGTTTPVDITGWTIVFLLFAPGGLLLAPIATMTAVIDAATGGLGHIPSIPKATTATFPSNTRGPAGFPWHAQRSDAGFERVLGFGLVPVRS